MSSTTSRARTSRAPTSSLKWSPSLPLKRACARINSELVNLSFARPVDRVSGDGASARGEICCFHRLCRYNPFIRGISVCFTPSSPDSGDCRRTCPYPEQFRREADHAHQVVRQGKHQHHAFDLAEPAHPKLLQAAVAGLRIDAFGGGCAPLVDGLRFVRAHALPPRRYCGAVASLGLVRIDCLVLGRGYRTIHNGVLGGLLDLRVADEPPVDQPCFGRLAAALRDLLDHRHHLPLVAADRGHLDADDHQAIGIRGQLRVVGGPEAAVAHLHHRRVGIGHRGARRHRSVSIAVANRRPA
ncbi:hypothetical protein ebA4532 [Aromatoleum aromaticum EbN1]|uniref:Uncharacterized protein n=1 Tax=Aromatoleum aromaticum (strain DSM 19018 / LMG 30748 / EbN1) TaxID=76114 RepID=Q5P1X1_AROAE|nr:hypothetical protein ebA4532 [Aromatoleum aromaticum EbN1]